MLRYIRYTSFLKERFAGVTQWINEGEGRSVDFTLGELKFMKRSICKIVTESQTKPEDLWQNVGQYFFQLR